MPRRFVTVEEFLSDDFDFDDATYSALAEVSLRIAREREASQREIKALLEQGRDNEALDLMRKYFAVIAPKPNQQARRNKNGRSGEI